VDDLAPLAVSSDEDFFKARMTQIQFRALGVRCSPSVVLAELETLKYRRAIKAARHSSPDEIVRWLRNGWNTEFLLRANHASLEGEALRHSLQWAFAQAYYSAYAVSLAFFKAVGFTETSHAAVIWKIGDLMSRDCYPASIGFIAKGGHPITFQNIAKGVLVSALYFDPSDRNCVDTHICHFLNGTRRGDLKSKKADLKLRTKGGKVKKKFSDADWEVASAKLGVTSLLSLLYRKRIKANYRDIETFLSEYLEANVLYDNLISVVSAANLAHEAFIAKAIGSTEYAAACGCLPIDTHGFILERSSSIATLDAQQAARIT
jgi:hypothetical protein